MILIFENKTLRYRRVSRNWIALATKWEVRNRSAFITEMKARSCWARPQQRKERYCARRSVLAEPQTGKEY
jgi:hypothetical protein